MKENPNLDVLYKMGSRGSSYYERQGDYMDQQMQSTPSPYNHYRQEALSFDDHQDLELVDSTGAGDSLTAAYAVAMLEGKSATEALKFANQAAFLAASKMGAGPAMPTRGELGKVFGDAEVDERYDSLQDHCFYGMLRHAEKANLHDKDNPRWVVEKDPPCSRRGERQAVFTGEYLKDYFEKHNMKFDKIVIETSPFMRCIQTANGVAVALGADEVEINYLIAEYLYPRDFPDHDPVPKLQAVTIDDLNKKEFKEFHLLSDKVTFKDKGFWKGELSTRWPEKLGDLPNRAMLSGEYFSKRMDEFKQNGDLDDGRTVCFLLVSHGMMILHMGVMLDHAGEKDEGDYSIAWPNPITFKDVTEGQKDALVDKVKDLDWQYDDYFENGDKNPRWLDYCALNAFAVKHNGETE